jgi:hypothetical protein
MVLFAEFPSWPNMLMEQAVDPMSASGAPRQYPEMVHLGQSAG